jgi:hypothetical protein
LWLIFGLLQDLQVSKKMLTILKSLNKLAQNKISSQMKIGIDTFQKLKKEVPP